MYPRHASPKHGSSDYLPKSSSGWVCLTSPLPPIPFLSGHLPGKRIGKLRDGLGAVAAGRQGKIGRASSLIKSWLYAVRIRS
ncbi:hypothetical protein M0657_009990 [Pyricularia oryzae]|uniref:Uncharacterized protein n=3 Tax=Pyricularia oryzae TaxID=318829 RepID=A0A4P7NBY4_PYROR|nr:hypothetical protein OOU_Y34scaffold00734g4 [Pyricularia oryzae Y34]KAI7912746.1 hypothetical protein M9X92_009829 [Pyricularia oryzae]KAI7913543.1 hypothetical protein M0657_009990 [Pyricularia oryzae]QBZ57844.1 hypothetical protein PoMZ_02779 [Pyricularia oryzae]